MSNFLKENNRLLIMDYLVITLVLYFVMYITYQPYFFGDELHPFENTLISGGSIFKNWLISNEYKPRLLFNIIWSFLSEINANRYAFAFIEFISLLAISILVHTLMTVYLKLNRITTYMILFSIIFSRYGIMLYYDYISGIIGILSTAFLMLSIFFIYLILTKGFNNFFAILAYLFAMMAAFTYETTIIPLAMLGMYILFVKLFFVKEKNIKYFIFWSLYTFTPILFFFFSTILFSNHSVLMGTAGQKVGIGIDTLWTFLTYIYNILGGNYGHDWFWGIYNYQHPIGKYIGYFTFITTLLIVTLAFYKKAFHSEKNVLAIGLVIAILSILAVSSLPGSLRQEARWLYPSGILILVLYAVYFKGCFRTALLLMVLATNIFYFLSNSYYSICNVVASKSAKSLAYSIEHLKVTEDMNCAIVGFSDNNWIIGKDSIFSMINFNSNYNIKYVDEKSNGNLNEFNCFLKFDGFDARYAAKYKLISKDILLLETGRKKISDLETDIKISELKNFDKFKGYIQKVNHGIVLKPQKDAFIELSSNVLKDKMLVYKAYSVDNNVKVPMRLQINWMNHEKKFISAQIKVVDVNNSLSDFGIIVSPPKNAKFGYVYTTLHDGAKSDVILESIELKKIK